MSKGRWRPTYRHYCHGFLIFLSSSSNFLKKILYGIHTIDFLLNGMREPLLFS